MIVNIDKLVDDHLEAVIGIEGGYVNDPNDAGGATRWGVTENVARAYGYAGDMRHLPRDQAKGILRHLAYVKPGFHLLAEISPKIAFEMFEIETNLPPGKAGRFLQRAMNGCNDPKGTGLAKDLLYPDLVVDGKVGEATRTALRKFLKYRGKSGETVLLRLINSQQAVYYIERVEARPKNERFLYGWILHRISCE